MNEFLKLLNGEIDFIEFDCANDDFYRKEELIYISEEEASFDSEVGFYVNKIPFSKDEEIKQIKVSDKYVFSLLATL